MTVQCSLLATEHYRESYMIRLYPSSEGHGMTNCFKGLFYFIFHYIYFKAHQHKAAGVKIKLSKSKNNDHDGLITRRQM